MQWARDNLKMIRNAAETEAICHSVEDNGGVYVVPAFAGLFAPYWRSDARGVICGLTAFNTSAHIVRACVEAAAYQVKDILDAMASDSHVRLHTLRCDGGMTANAFLMQFQADVIDVAVAVPRIAETTALGAAFAAGLATGFYKSQEQLSRQWQMGREWLPHMPRAQRDFLASRWCMAIDRSLDWHGPDELARTDSEARRIEMVRSGSSGKALDSSGVPTAAAWVIRAAAVAAIALASFISGRHSRRV